MPRAARLKIHGEGGAEVALISDYLRDLEGAYNSLIAFESVMVDHFYDDWRLAYLPRNRIGRRRTGRPVANILFTAEEVESTVPSAETLVMAAVHLASPGIWEFLGSLNALEVIRKYLHDRHERRKDKAYRESADQRRLELDNLHKENVVIAERIRLAKDLGATNRDLAPILNQLIGQPLRRLDRYQDKGLIGDAEIAEEK
ncbi:hypothetical protein SAMN02745126_04340 [Enhydrobacter aerosaccus]|uniref:Uncharacterized protein n=1 Tax=Enhydrobacter aerosaccus TaxID=225324 RepID=A0A1T4S6P1_9HYPH|nr:hypothetical protein [Enhydrobacter aerosaccus]SKA23746.1 hypothetical protein SAMN02745126_04340 [Enhydrobacter aerosaccus]